MNKSAEAFRTIGEVASDLDVPKHVLRFWEGKFPQIRPMKRGGGRRYYRPEDMELLRGIRHLLHAEGYTIKGVQKILREQGIDSVKAASRAALAATASGGPRSRRGRRAGVARQSPSAPPPAPAITPVAEIGALDGAVVGKKISVEQIVAAAVRELEIARAMLRAPQPAEAIAEHRTRVART